eukprot:TRINITY_DN9712_c0_g1_i1.p1 TRINITY_DN9712_c0_g1~~TRINITY_DN9712_c0_g1_i1.p1  ORF type:complete len:215 (-),score=47.42 TRINITY_DN9712_c0_g1_i1:76-720(-)
MKAAAASYTASFLCRAKYLPPALLKEGLTTLVGWASSYSDRVTNFTVDVDMHGVFYAICYSIFYIYCFHFEFLSTDPAYLTSLNLTKLLTSPLNPLKFLSASIIEEMERICIRRANTLWIQIIERNKDFILPTFTISGAPNILDVFFPFDPPQLDMLARHIEPIYSEFKGTSDDNDSTSQSPHLGRSIDSPIGSDNPGTPMSCTPIEVGGSYLM